MKPKRLSPRKMFVLGFFGVIMAGTFLLMLPAASAKEALGFADALFMSTSCVCVTGLATIDPGTGLTFFGQLVMAVLIQIGGLGITSIGVMVIMAAGGKFSISKQQLVKESLNLSSNKGLLDVVKSVSYVTLLFESAGVICAFITYGSIFSSGSALWKSIFHSVAAFNNAGFDLMGDFRSLVDFSDDIWLCVTTTGLIIFGGLGFFVIKELASFKHPRTWTLHTKVVLCTTICLILAGTLMLKITEGSGITWLEAYFQSVSARTAGFATISMGDVSKAGLLVIMVLMFIGASPGSTGGGVKTTTFFVLFEKSISTVLNGHCSAFRRQLPESSVMKAFMVSNLALLAIMLSTFAVCMLEPEFTFEQILFEVVSGFATTGFSTGITPELSEWSKVIISATMFVGRVGPLTLATMWLSRSQSAAHYSTEDVNIG